MSGLEHTNFAVVHIVTPAGKGEAHGGLSWSQKAAIFVGILLLCLLIGGTVAAALALRRSHVKKSKDRKRLLKLSKCPISARNDIYHEMSLLSPGIMKSLTFEFPRSNLELQDVLGRSLYYNIVSVLPCVIVKCIVLGI